MAVDPRNHPYLFAPIVVDRVNDRFLAPGTSSAPKDKTTAAQVLFREGFTFEQVAEMFGYVKESDRP